MCLYTLSLSVQPVREVRARAQDGVLLSSVLQVVVLCSVLYFVLIRSKIIGHVFFGDFPVIEGLLKKKVQRRDLINGRGDATAKEGAMIKKK